MNAAAGGAVCASPCEAPQALLARLFETVRAKSDDFASQLHPAWVDASCPGFAGDLRSLRDGVLRQEVSKALRATYVVQWPSLTSLADRLHRTALLPRPVLTRLLCAWAMFQRRQQVLRCVDRASRMALMDLVGEAAFGVIVGAVDIEVAASEPLPASVVSGETLAAWAFDRLDLQGAWACPRARTLVAWSLSPAALGRTPRATQAGRRPPSLSLFVDRLDRFFPEYAWLFGYDMDRALSA